MIFEQKRQAIDLRKKQKALQDEEDKKKKEEEERKKQEIGNTCKFAKEY
jgi:hypothetical protein